MILYHICRPVSKRNKMHDREIALWNARMRIYFDANIKKRFQLQQRKSLISASTDSPLDLEQLTSAPDESYKLMEAHSRLPIRLILCNASKNRLGCRNLWRHSQLQTWWTHIFFFSLFPFLFFSSRMLWLVVSLSACPRVPAMELFIHLCLRRPVLNKTRDREIALRNARMRIYFDANLWNMPFSSRRSVGFRNDHCLQ